MMLPAEPWAPRCDARCELTEARTVSWAAICLDSTSSGRFAGIKCATRVSENEPLRSGGRVGGISVCAHLHQVAFYFFEVAGDDFPRQVPRWSFMQFEPGNYRCRASSPPARFTDDCEAVKVGFVAWPAMSLVSDWLYCRPSFMRFGTRFSDLIQPSTSVEVLSVNDLPSPTGSGSRLRTGGAESAVESSL